DDEVERVVIGVAAHEYEEIAAPVRHPEAEHLGVELDDLLHVEHAIGDVAKLEDVEHARRLVAPGEFVLGIEVDRRALGIIERDRLRAPGRYIFPALGLDAHPAELLDDVAEVAAGRDLERHPLEIVRLALHQLDRLEPLLAAEEHAVLAALDDGEPEEATVV